ncbi:MAG: hypothetical protein KME27_10880 [Lyngbya sp. HA4199-MV5]|jgi:hypothetical protein|nr:hypothetical protein [Lyngbya sp. HA4199-MV5]
MNQPQATFDGEPVTVAQSTTPGKLMRDGEALYHVKLEPLPSGGMAQYWLTQSEVEQSIKGGFAAIRRLQQAWLNQVA